MPSKNLRLERLRELISERKINGVLIVTDYNCRYLSGFTVEDHQFDEISAALIITENAQLLFTDSRFELQAHAEARDWDIIIYRQSLSDEIASHCNQLGIKTLGFESHRLTVQRFDEIHEKINKLKNPPNLIPVLDLVETLRVVKDDTEIDLTRKALHMAERAFTEVVKNIQPGMTEKEIAWDLEKRIRQAGADGLSFPSIVATGENSALPHAVPSERKLQKGEPLLIDWGCKIDGYCSDTTRTLVFGEPDDIFKRVHHCVLEAQKRAIEVIKAGVNGRMVDATARDYINGSGFEGKFGHGLGHGTGLAVHEGPRLSPIRDDILKEGMIVTVEPGIYLPGWGGIRIEHQVIVRADGAEVMNDLSTTFDPSAL